MIRCSALGPWLKSFREQRQEDRTTVSCRLLKSKARSTSRFRWFFGGSQITKVGTEGLLKAFENGERQEVRPVQDVLPLVRAYKVSELMLGPLMARELPDEIVVHRLSEFRSFGLKGGKKAIYLFAPTRLASASSFFVLVDLQSFGVSDTHSHPGNELLLCLGGNVEVRMKNSGIRLRLGRQEFAHFLSEQTHSAHNLSKKPAKLLIVRFMHPSGGPLLSVQEAMKDLQSEIGSRKMKHAKATFEDRLLPWILQMLSGPAKDIEKSEWKVLDPVGLSRFVNQLSEEAPDKSKYTVRALEKRAKSIGYKRGRDFFFKLRHGVLPADVGLADLRQIAKVLNVPGPLLAHFLAPRVPYLIAVNDRDDLIRLPAQLDRKGHGHYEIPRHNLADSDCSITFLNLRRRETSMTNNHPGYELALPLTGEIAIELLGPSVVLKKDVSSRRTEFAHYASTSAHRIRNIGRVAAKVLIVRFSEFLTRQVKSTPETILNQRKSTR